LLPPFLRCTSSDPHLDSIDQVQSDCLTIAFVRKGFVCALCRRAPSPSFHFSPSGTPSPVDLNSLSPSPIFTRPSTAPCDRDLVRPRLHAIVAPLLLHLQSPSLPRVPRRLLRDRAPHPATRTSSILRQRFHRSVLRSTRL